MNKNIKFHFVDFYLRFNHTKFITYNLKENFIIEFNSSNPDYLIYITQGREHLNCTYNKAVTIAYLSENSIIDFE